MDRELYNLKKENERLQKLQELDYLTGIFHRGAMEKKINEVLSEKRYGVLFIIDIDNFKEINENYGHSMGDATLCRLTEMLQTITLRNDILGRVGGDEFVIFMPIAQNISFVENRCKQMQKSLKKLQLDDKFKLRISLTIAGSIYKDEDTFTDMFDRAASSLYQKKQEKEEDDYADLEDEQYVEFTETRGIQMDMQRIYEELREQVLLPGAYCQNYEVFKSIYRFIERQMKRNNSSAYIILITMTDDKQGFPKLQTRTDLLKILMDEIQHSLRAGDVFTQYSSCQFLIMVSDVNEEQAKVIGERICNSFYKRQEKIKEHILVHHCYPLSPAK